MGPIRRLGTTRERLAWWGFVAVLAAAFLFVVYSFVGTVTLGIFLYYASRPVYERIESTVDSDGVAALITILVASVPILGLFVYTGVRVVSDLAAATDVGLVAAADVVARYVFGAELTGSGQEVVTTLLRNPSRIDSLSLDVVGGLLSGGLQTVGVVAGVLVHLGLAFTIAFALLRDGDVVAAWVRDNLTDAESAGYAYGVAVDRDLQTVYFGNVLFVFAVAGIGAVVYHGFNVVAPAGLTVPAPTLLALLTGVTSLIPLVVSKVVYLPVVAYLGVQAVRADGGTTLAYPIGLLVVAFLVLDILPQTLLQPFLAGRRISTELMMFAYILGPLLFGWYGIFLLPMLLVLGVQALRIVVVELIHGDRLQPDVDDARSMGANPASNAAPPPWADSAGPDRRETDRTPDRPAVADVTPDQSPAAGPGGGD